MENIGEKCIECLRSTEFGSGLFVNRIPADNGIYIGYMCPECWAMECDHCGQLSSEFGSDDQGGLICDDCAADKENSEYE